ncbi:CU044_5270 family protein [Actinomadura kijaniata]|uniref:CU044_5270 family protein n=1 Tax=Actinomadura kijaniata TaxID=46161 RepID=UPI003F1C81AC
MSRDVLRVLTEARPVELDPEARVDEATRTAELARAMAGTRDAHRGRARRVRPVWVLGLAGATAAAALVATAVVPDDPAAPRGPAPVALDARTVLLAAADRTAATPEGTGAYWHSRTLHRNHFPVTEGGRRYTIEVTQAVDSWTPARPKAKQWSRTQNLGFRPASAADRAEWQKAGSPTRVKVFMPISPRLKRLKPAAFDAAPGKAQVQSSPLVDGDKVYWIGRNVTMKQVRSLPTTPATLRKELLRWYKGHDTESNTPMPRDRWLFEVGGLLVTDLPVTAKTRAAAFRMLAELPGVRSIGKVRDAQGRTGVAVAATERTPNGVLQRRLVIDPARGAALASETIVLEPAGVNAELPPNSLLGSSTFTTTWTDKPLS